MGYLVGESMGDFVEEAFAEISEEEQQRIRADSRVVEALRSRNPSIGIVNIGTIPVKFRLSISKKLRRKLALYKSKIGDSEPTMDEVDQVLYDLLSSLSIEEPWNDWKTWSVFDDSSDEGAQEILMQMLKQINSHMEDVKNFR